MAPKARGSVIGRFASPSRVRCGTEVSAASQHPHLPPPPASFPLRGRLREFSLLLPPSTSCAKHPFLGGVLSRSYLRLPWAETSAVVFAVFLTRVPFRVCPGLGCRLSHGRARGGGRRGGFSLRASTSGRTSYRHHTKSEYFFVFESTAAEPRVPGS